MRLIIAKTAKDALERSATKCGLSDPVAAIVWTTDIGGSNGGWRIGFYERDKVPEDWILSVDEIELVIDPTWREKLDGKTVNYANGYFDVA